MHDNLVYLQDLVVHEDLEYLSAVHKLKRTYK